MSETVNSDSHSKKLASPTSNIQHPKDQRLPHCQRCAQHNVRNRLRGHKSSCPFRDCECAKCLTVVERQRLMADQIKLRRQQRKQRNLHKIRQSLEQSISQPAQQSDSDQKPTNRLEQQLPINPNFPSEQQKYFSFFDLQSLFNQY